MLLTSEMKKVDNLEKQSSEELRRQNSQSKGRKYLLEKKEIMDERLNDLNNTTKVHTYKLNYESEKTLEEQGRRHTCDQAMYRDKVNFDYKYGLKVQKQYSLQWIWNSFWQILFQNKVLFKCSEWNQLERSLKHILISNWLNIHDQILFLDRGRLMQYCNIIATLGPM